MTREERLGRTFVELADNLVNDFDVIELLVRVSERSVELFDATAAGVLLADPVGNLRLMAATSEASEMVELFEVQSAQGPCRDCFLTGAQVAAPDLAREEARWPGFGPVALHSGFRAVHALPLRLRERTLGALNLFRAPPGPMAIRDLASAQALADIATIALIQHQAVQHAQELADQLRAALDSRIAIEQAKGVIAERARVDVSDAFGLLRGYARDRQRRLGDVAQDVVDGTIPPGTIGG